MAIGIGMGKRRERGGGKKTEKKKKKKRAVPIPGMLSFSASCFTDISLSSPFFFSTLYSR